MKFIAGIAACAGAAWAFADTAAFYSSRELTPLGYIADAAAVGAAFAEYTEHFCLDNPHDTLYVYRVAQLQRGAPAEGTYVQHVHYKSGAAVNWAVSPKCTVEYHSAVPEHTHSNVVVVDIEDGHAHSVAEFVGAHAVVVQGKPGFHTAGSRGEHIKDFLGDALHVDIDELIKRADGVEDDDVATAQEVEDDFCAAESMIAAEDSMVTALSDEEYTAYAAGNSTAKSNLFTQYQFFTPGVWLALIVSLFLLYVATTAVGWITSIQLSYGAFEKQVDYEKKTE